MARKKDKTIVLIGTYKGNQLEKWPNNYNYPISDADKITKEEAKRINELWLFKGTTAQKTFSAKFVGIKTREELIEKYNYPATGKAHSDKYLLFKITPIEYPSIGDKKVILRTKDFASSKKLQAQLKAYLASDERGTPEIATKLPEVVRTIPKENLCVCESAIQMDFFGLLDNTEKKLSKFKTDKSDKTTLRFIDLFAGIGGVRKGFEQACKVAGLKSQCVFTSEIKPHAVKILLQNNPQDHVHGDITTVDEKTIPDFDILLGGFPCQAFSAAGKRHGFEDTRGTLFFDVARILKEKKPFGFILENVEGLVNHDKRDTNAPYGNTLKVILQTLDELGYKTSWRVLNAKDFGVAQERKRIYIIGTKSSAPSMENFEQKKVTVGDILEHGLPPMRSAFIDKLLSHYSVKDLYGKSVKDKRGGKNNIHSWDIELKGNVTKNQKQLLNLMLKERRKHHWADVYGIDWMDGMPLTVEMIRTFFDAKNLEEMLEDLVVKKYIVKEHPKRRVKVGNLFERREDPTLPLGYNIVAGKLSFQVSKVLHPEEYAPTLVAMDMQRLFVVDGDAIRNLSLREGLNLFGYPKDFKFNIEKKFGYDLLGNTVVVPVIQEVAGRVIDVYNREFKEN